MGPNQRTIDFTFLWSFEKKKARFFSANSPAPKVLLANLGSNPKISYENQLWEVQSDQAMNQIVSEGIQAVVNL